MLSRISNSIFVNDFLWQKVEKEISEWINTPYRDNFSVKGIGVDCVRFTCEVFRSVFPSFNCPDLVISPEWWLHTKKEVLLGNIITALMQQEVKFELYQARQKNIELLYRGDLLLYAIGKEVPVNHVAIYCGDNTIVHASSFAKKVIKAKFNEKYLKMFLRITGIPKE